MKMNLKSLLPIAAMLIGTILSSAVLAQESSDNLNKVTELQQAIDRLQAELDQLKAEGPQRV